MDSTHIVVDPLAAARKDLYLRAFVLDRFIQYADLLSSIQKLMGGLVRDRRLLLLMEILLLPLLLYLLLFGLLLCLFRLHPTMIIDMHNHQSSLPLLVSAQQFLQPAMKAGREITKFQAHRATLLLVVVLLLLGVQSTTVVVGLSLCRLVLFQELVEIVQVTLAIKHAVVTVLVCLAEAAELAGVEGVEGLDANLSHFFPIIVGEPEHLNGLVLLLRSH